MAEQEETGLATLPLVDIPGIDHTTNTSMWKRDPRSPLVKSGPPGSCDSAMASDPKVFYDNDQEVPLSCSHAARINVLSFVSALRLILWSLALKGVGDVLLWSG